MRRDKFGDVWTIVDSALCWTLAALIAVFIVGNVALFLAPEPKQTALRPVQYTQQTVAGTQVGSPASSVGR